MNALAVIAALLLEQWRPVGDRASYAAALAAGADWLERSFNAGESRHGLVAWLVAVVPVLVVAAVLYYALLWASPLLALAFNVLALYLTLGFRQFSHYFTDLQLAVRAGDTDRARELIGAWRGEAAQHRSREEQARYARLQRLADDGRAAMSPIAITSAMAPPTSASPASCTAAGIGRLSSSTVAVIGRTA